LTAAEREHASKHAKLTDQHFYASVLQSLPEAQAHLDDTPVFYPSMGECQSFWRFSLLTGS